MRAKEEGSAENEGSGERVQSKRAGEIATELFVGAGVTAVLELGSYGRVLTFWIGWVTMLISVMPACLTASITEAKAPKGTRSSARR